MCHVGVPQFLWPQAVRYAAHQLNMWPSVAWPRVTTVFLWTGSRGVAADYRVWGSLAHVRAPGANKLSARTRTCVFRGFPPSTFGWQFYDPVTCQLFSSQGVTFEKSVSYYKSCPHHGSESLSPQLFQGVSQVTPRSSPPQRLVHAMSGGAGGAAAEGEGIGAGSGCLGGVGVETTPVEDTGVLSRRPRPASPLGFPPVPQFHTRSSLQLVDVESGDVSAGGTGSLEGVVGGVSGFGGAGARDAGPPAPTPCTVRFQTRAQRLLRLERED
ncbi:unnamed protein product [Closterium sp. NIES-53]